ncbi:MAG: phosphotransferase [Oscillospiraceae bacterium]|nr:phosphotransferase [Oscillospiraceae bacterium]
MSDNIMLNKLISDNYDLEVKDLQLIEGQFCEIYTMQTNKGKYVVKTLHLGDHDMEQEGHLTKYLYDNGISVPRLLKTSGGMYHVETEDMQFHIQEFIEGRTWKVNTATEWFLEKLAVTIGKVHDVLKNYGELKSVMSDHFLNKNIINYLKDHYTEKLNEAITTQKDKQLISDLEERVRYLERVAKFDININRLTYSNSHADFHMGQIITDGENLTVIDWTSACRMPICFEVIRSYVFAAPECGNGEINSDGLKRYINNYLKYFPLNDYDIEMMPYVFYFQHMIWNYNPAEYDNIPNAYKPIRDLIINVTNWLYENVDVLADELR